MPRLRVIRAFRESGMRREVGELVDVSIVLAQDLVAAGKAVREATSEERASSGPLTTDSAADLVPGAKTRKSRHAQQ